MSEYIVNRLGQLGDGIIDSPSGEIFAPFTLPGEHITGKIENGRINTPKIIKPVSDRIKPVCNTSKIVEGVPSNMPQTQSLQIGKLKKPKMHYHKSIFTQNLDL